MSSMKDLARIISQRTSLNRAESEAFVTAFFDVAKEALANDTTVKIKGLGTFKLQTMKQRESVNISTGERVVIDSHDRITFTPDASMRDAVNKPFSHFETVVLNDGVVFNDTNEEEEIDVEEITDEQHIDESVIENTVEEIVTKEEIITKEEITDESINKDIAEKSKTKIPVEYPIFEDNDDEEDITDVNKKSICKYILYGIIIFVIGFAIGRITSDFTINISFQKVSIPISTTNGEDTISKPLPNSKITEKNTERNDSTISTAKMESEETTYKSDSISSSIKETKEKGIGEDDVRVRTGAYKIVGVKTTITATEGQTVASISRTYLGPDPTMVCYIEALNGKDIKAGQKVKIPELKLKKSLKK